MDQKVLRIFKQNFDHKCCREDEMLNLWIELHETLLLTSKLMTKKVFTTLLLLTAGIINEQLIYNCCKIFSHFLYL